MKKCLFVLLNKIFLKDLEALYGKGSVVEINYIKYCTNNQRISVDCKVLITDIELFEEVGLSGLNYLIEESWKFTGYPSDNLTIISSYDLK